MSTVVIFSFKFQNGKKVVECIEMCCLCLVTIWVNETCECVTGCLLVGFCSDNCIVCCSWQNPNESDQNQTQYTKPNEAKFSFSVGKLQELKKMLQFVIVLFNPYR